MRSTRQRAATSRIIAFLNKTLTKRELDAFIGDLVEHYGPNTIAAALDVIKSLTFRFATRAGITISKNDIVIPGDKEEILAGYEEEVTKVGTRVRPRPHDRGGARRAHRRHLDARRPTRSPTG